MRRILLLCALSGCRPAPAPPAQPPPRAARAAAVLPLSEPERVRLMEQDLGRLATADAQRHAVAYARLAQRARDGDRAARAVQLVFTVRDALRDGCADQADRQAFRQALEMLEMHLKDATPGERVFAGPTLLLGLQAAGRAAEQPPAAAAVVRAAQAVWADNGEARAELLAEVAHALRQGCHLRAAVPYLEDAVALLRAGPDRGRSEPALLARRDLATLRFLVGDGQSAQRDLEALWRDLREVGGAGEELEARMEVVQVLRGYLVGERKGPPPRETGPGWQALRTVQQQASCPEATPAEPQLLRVPVPPPACEAK